jgi:ElaB/YqjD/DUF883 family membrane-anchored ribosome-binding protein
MSVNVSLNPSAVGAAETHYTATPVAQAARHVADNGLHKDRIMNLVEENARNEKLLGRLDLELLSQEIVAHGAALAELVGRHNDHLVALAERHGKLVEDRKRLMDFTVWADAKLDDVLAERASLVRETWNWLLALRAELAQREAILGKAENVLQAMLTDLTAQREQTVARLSKSMAKVHDAHVKANPFRGEAHFGNLVSSDDAVVAIDRERDKLRADLEWVTDHGRRASVGQSTVLMRQEEVFGHVVEARQ